MQRRQFLQALGAASVAVPAAATARGSTAGDVTSLELYSTCSLLDASGDLLTDDSTVAVWAEDTATNGDADWWSNAVDYGSTPIPLVAVDGGVVGVGSTLVADGEPGSEADNLQFYLNVLDAEVGGGTVLFDEGHDQYWTLGDFSEFRSAAADRGYDVRVTTDLEADLPGADAVVVMPPRRDFSAAEQEAVASFVADGGTAVLHDQSDYSDYDQGFRLNPVLERAGAGFRFNDDQVTDDANNAGNPWEPVTGRFNEGFPYFGSGGGGGGGNEAPSASFTLDAATVTTGESVTADAGGSADPDGSIARYEWAFGDGTTATGVTATHSYDSAGDYTVRLTVTDDDGATASATETVTVESGGGGGGSDRTEVTVTEVLDGDTVKIEKDDGTTESIRVLGVDTAEKPSNQRYEREQEWEGIESLDVLGTWGNNATDFAKNRFSPGDTVDIAFDPAEGRRDPFDRLLAYIYYDATGDGSRDTLYNEELIREGQARVYGSALSKQDEFWRAEQEARAANRGIWANSDPANSTVIRNDPVEEVYVPRPAPVETSAGDPAAARVPVSAESSASPGGAPLVAVDEDARVAMAGGLLINEDYEQEEDFAVDTSGYGNFPLVANLIDYLADTGGDVLIDGGHGQFGADYALSNEDAAYFQRYLEGFDIGFDQTNDVTVRDLSAYRALVVTTPAEDLTAAERDAIASFRDSGGAVILMGSSAAGGTPRSRLNDLASALGSDLRLGSGSVTDGSNNLNSNEALPVTSNFETSLPLFSAYGDSGGGGGGGGEDGGEIAVDSVNADPAGDDSENLVDEYVVFSNPGSAANDLTGYTVEDEAGASYAFPDGFSLAPGATVTLHTGSGTDTASDLYWGRGSSVWNNDGDTVTVYDDAGSQVASKTYSGSDDGSGGGSGSNTETFSGSLSGEGDTALFEYATAADAPSEVRLTLSGPGDADFDLYVTTDGRAPTTYDYDRRSWNYGSSEEIVLSGSAVDADTTLGIMVDSYSGAGSYELTVEETA